MTKQCFALDPFLSVNPKIHALHEAETLISHEELRETSIVDSQCRYILMSNKVCYENVIC